MINNQNIITPEFNDRVNLKENKIIGFTLIEVMIVVSIIGILATIAYPSYVEQVTRSNRAEALRELTRLANLQEQYFIDNRRYTGKISDLGVGSSSNYTTDSKNYLIEVRNFDVSLGVFTLRANAQGNQLSNDKDCKWIDITNTGAKTAFKPVCWEP